MAAKAPSIHRPPSPADRADRIGWLVGITLVALIGLAGYGPIVQWADYHAFADSRSWGALPNAANVLSNLPFAIFGAWGLHKLSGTPAALPWRVFAAAVGLTALGSSTYHWQPDNTSLVTDRLPIAVACASLMCAFLAERVSPRWADLRVVTAAVIAAILSVAWWWYGARHGAGDLRGYVAVQFLPMLLIPAAMVLKIRTQRRPIVPDAAWWSALGLYGAAKVLEWGDGAVLTFGGIVSGHSLKHLLAAAAAALLLRAALLSCGSRR